MIKNRRIQNANLSWWSHLDGSDAHADHLIDVSLVVGFLTELGVGDADLEDGENVASVSCFSVWACLWGFK